MLLPGELEFVTSVELFNAKHRVILTSFYFIQERERDHFSQFITEGFTSYCKRKRRDKVCTFAI